MNKVFTFLNDITSQPISFSLNKSDIIDYGDSFYEKAGELYAHFFAEVKEDDIEFYRNIARKTGGPILEAACGTGRVMIPLLNEGYQVYGSDFSIKMLTLSKKKIFDESVRNKTLLCNAKLEDLPFKNFFNLVLVPYNSFNHILKDTLHLNAVRNFYRILKPGGLLVMEILPYHEVYNNQIKFRKNGLLPGTGENITMHSKVEQDKINRTHTVNWFITVETKHKETRRFKCRFTRKDLPLEYVTGLITRNGFEIENIYYNYEMNGDDKFKRIIIAKRK